ncbi:GNAT family N-acetyltransferase [Nocardioides litoris]|uniref:GNAT family N-acetyltransferase n=1 Tax=Nocardioides litoris TaxID=1926648 RepID=UPI00112209BE|nr:GNAT family N-acetyltransferase [Nocardioides litoris]
METIRLGPDDWETFREVRLRSLAEAPAAFGSRYADWVDAPEERWRQRLTDVPLTLVARAEGRVVGVVSGTRAEDGWAELISLWVDPALRGTGVVTDLVEAVVAWGAEQGRSTYLMVRADNARARAAYERAGFVDVGVPDDWPDDEPPEHRMERAG